MTCINELRAATSAAAQTARSQGLITEFHFAQMTDGTVSRCDLRVAEQLVEQANVYHQQTASALETAVANQYQAQCTLRTTAEWLKDLVVRLGTPSEDVDLPSVPTTPPGGPVVIGPADNGKIVLVPKGVDFVVELPSNPSTGYRWVVASGTDNNCWCPPPLGAPTSEEFIPAPGSEGLEGAGGTQRFVWKTDDVSSASSTNGQVKLEYRRAWEEEPIDTFSVCVQFLPVGVYI